MKPNLSIILLFLATALTLHGETYRQQFDQAKSTNDHQKIDAIAKEWVAKEADNPDAYIVPANYYFETHGILIVGDDGKPLPEGTFDVVPAGKGVAVVDKNTGKRIGSIKDDTRRDPADVDRATGILQQGIVRLPTRLDIRCGLAYMFQETGQFDHEFDVLRDMVAFAKTNPKNLTGPDGKPSKTPLDVRIPKLLHDYVVDFINMKTPETDEHFFKIAQLSAENYPNHPYAFNDMALYYSLQKDYVKTVKYLEYAMNADPKDTLVLLNLGDNYLDLGEKTKAKESYKRIIQIAPNSADAKSAKEALSKMN